MRARPGARPGGAGAGSPPPPARNLFGEINARCDPGVVSQGALAATRRASECVSVAVAAAVAAMAATHGILMVPPAKAATTAAL